MPLLHNRLSKKSAIVKKAGRKQKKKKRQQPMKGHSEENTKHNGSSYQLYTHFWQADVHLHHSLTMSPISKFMF